MTTPQNDSLLSSSITVGQYLAMELAKDQGGISSFIRDRFYERYILPFDDNKKRTVSS